MTIATTTARPGPRGRSLAGWIFLAFALLAGFGPARAQAPITVTDMLGRQVTLAAPAKRIVLPEGRHILTLGLLDKDPLSLVVAWGDDLRRYAPQAFAALRARFPQAGTMPEIGRVSGGSFSLEAVIAAKPDLVVFTLYGPVPEGLSKLDDAKIPYVFVDFFREPLTKTVPSMRLLGRLLGREREAEAFVAYYEHHMGEVSRRVKEIGRRPEVFFHLNPDGKDCCLSTGTGNMTDFIAAAGGHSIGADRIPGAIGRLSLEYVLSRNPDFYLVGGGSTVAPNGLKVGPSVAPAEAQRSLAGLAGATGIASLEAVRQGRAAGIWLFFFDNPLFFVGVEAIARMLHPEPFADLDPDRTMAELNRRFLAFPLEGTFWVGPGPKAPGKAP